MTFSISGCASVSKSERIRLAKLESRLRTAQIKIETLREQNAVLKNRIKIAKESGIDDEADPALAEPLAAFKPGVQLDVPISESRARTPTMKRQEVSLVPTSLPRKRFHVASLRAPAVAAPNQAPSEVASDSQAADRADRVLARTVTDLLKSGDSLEAGRTAALLEKSYPESELIAETRFQQGLYFYRKKNLHEADRFFQATLRAPKTHLRAKAGAVLMRGIIARRLATDGAVAGRSPSTVEKNLALSRKSFEYVRKAFPLSPEAKRASRELHSMNSNSVAVQSRTK